MSVSYVTQVELGRVSDVLGSTVSVSYGSFPEYDGGGIEGVVTINGTSAVFDPSEDDSLAMLRQLIGHLQELERVGTMRR